MINEKKYWFIVLAFVIIHGVYASPFKLPLMDRVRSVKIDSLSDDSILLNIKKLINNVLLQGGDNGNNCLDYCPSLMVQDRQEIDDSSEDDSLSDDSTAEETQKLLEKNLSKHMVLLTKDFFKTCGYVQTKKNIEAFKEFVLSCPSWKLYKNDQKIQLILKLCEPENCFKQNDFTFEYIYKNKQAIGARCNFCAAQRLFKNVTIEAAYSYSYLFKYNDQRVLKFNEVTGSVCVIPKHIVPICVVPGRRFNGKFGFVCSKGQITHTINYVFSLCGPEEIYLTEAFPIIQDQLDTVSCNKEFDKAVEIGDANPNVLDDVDLAVPVGDVPYLNNYIFYSTSLDPIKVNVVF